MKNYNQTLQINNSSLEEILNTINELPEAGGSNPILQDKTVTPTTSEQTIIADSGYDGLDTVTVNAIPSAYIKPTATKKATTYTPTTSNQTIAAGTYCSGAQTIKGDANLKAENIKSGVSIFGINGTLEGSSGEISLQNKTITSNGTYTADSGYDGLGTVTVKVGSNNDLLKKMISRSELFSITAADIQGVSSIGGYAFNNCTNLTSIVIPDSATSINSYAFSGCYKLTSVIIGDSVTSIGSHAFAGCTALVDLTIGDSVTSIGQQAFSSCSKLTSVTIPDSVTSIGSSAFYKCTSLTSVTIGNGVTSIDSRAFYGCTKVTRYDFSSHTSVPTLANTEAFRDIPSNCKIKVPSALYNEWIAATNWSTYASHIEAV